MRLYPTILLALAPLVIASLTSHAAAQESEVIAGGEIEYQRHCASCHGMDARGDGPLAKYLTVKPADLTQVAKKNGGEFPFWQTYRIIDGRDEIKAHGTREMPVWGQRFLAEQGSKDRYSETEVTGRILSLVFYLRHVQER
jgi:mono/diheme cytochrome c family protein